METATITLETGDGPMDLYEARPDRKASSAVVVVQEAFGVNEHIQDVARRFADEGLHAVAPAFFHRTGVRTAPYDDLAKALSLCREGLTDESILVDLDAATEQLYAAGFADSQIGVVGFCLGGRGSFLVALERAFGAAVGFYGGGIVTQPPYFPQFPALVNRAAALQTPWLGLFADLDAAISIDDVELLRGALREARVPTEIVRYPECQHGFHCDARRESYNEAAAKDGWARTLEWLGTHLST